MLVSPLLPQDGRTPLIWAAGKGATKTAAMLIDRGANLEAKGNVRREHLLMVFYNVFPQLKTNFKSKFDFVICFYFLFSCFLVHTLVSVSFFLF